jgi:hypothetical protein
MKAKLKDGMTPNAFAFHNLVGHPLMALLHAVGLHKAADWIHDATLPQEDI